MRSHFDFLDSAADVDRIAFEESDESFDRLAFARHALELFAPRRTRVALCSGTTRVRVASGRNWGSGPFARWAIVSVPENASRRAIALALVSLLGPSNGSAAAVPYALDVLLGTRDVWSGP